jgi:hypothetical protein
MGIVGISIAGYLLYQSFNDEPTPINQNKEKAKNKDKEQSKP